MRSKRSYLNFAVLVPGIVLVNLITGCDKPEPPPPDAPPQRVIPTTQQMLDGPRTPIPLGGLPFTLDVPAGWAVHSNGSGGNTISMLDGPLIGGDAHIILRARDDQSPVRMKTLLEHVRRDAPAIEKSGGLLSIRDMGEVRVVERRVAPAPPSTAPAASADKPLDAPVEWRVTLFVPSGVNYEQYELQFIDLTPAVFSQNAKVLSEIMASLKYSDPGRPPL